MLDKGKILYIEDAFENRLLVCRILAAEGYSVLEAENAQQAMDILSIEAPDLILIDIKLPGIDGYSLTAWIREIPHYTITPIVAITANAMRGDREKTIAAGCDGYIQKPIDVDTFPGVIAKFLNGHDDEE